MARASVDISDSKMEEVIDLMAAEKPITKKRACEILGISYNTARLDSLIQDYLDKKTRYAQRKAAKRGKPLDISERKDIVESYLAKEPMGDIAERHARSSAMIKAFIDKTGIPLRDSDSNYFNPPIIGDRLIREQYLAGEIVYSTQYQELAEIKAKVKASETAYRIWLSDTMQYANVPWYELADLSKLTAEHNAVFKMAQLDTPAAVQVAEALRKSKMLKKEKD